MYSTTITKLFFALCSLLCVTFAQATAAFSTSFDGSEGYTNGSLDQSIQTGAPNFNTTGYGIYLPGGQSPNFGEAKRDPNANNVRAIYVNGAGSDFTAGDSWTTSLDFTFEGLQASAIGADNFLTEFGFSTSATAKENALSVALMKASGQNSNYRMYVSTQGGSGYESTNLTFASLGDDEVDNDDLTDQLRFSVTLTKSATTNDFDLIAGIYNLDADAANPIKTITKTLTHANAYNSDLYGFFSSGAVKESGNFDLMNFQSFSYSAVPEPSTYALILGFGIMGLVILRRRS